MISDTKSLEATSAHTVSPKLLGNNSTANLNVNYASANVDEQGRAITSARGDPFAKLLVVRTNSETCNIPHRSVEYYAKNFAT